MTIYRRVLVKKSIEQAYDRCDTTMFSNHSITYCQKAVLAAKDALDSIPNDEPIDKEVIERIAQSAELACRQIRLPILSVPVRSCRYGVDLLNDELSQHKLPRSSIPWGHIEGSWK